MSDLSKFQTGLSGTTDQSLESMKVTMKAILLETQQQKSQISLMGLTSSMMAQLTEDSLNKQSEQTTMQAMQTFSGATGSLGGAAFTGYMGYKQQPAVDKAQAKLNSANSYEAEIRSVLRNPEARNLQVRVPVEANDAVASDKKIETDKRVEDLKSSDLTDSTNFEQHADTMRMMKDGELNQLLSKAKEAQKLAREELNNALLKQNNNVTLYSQVGSGLGQLAAGGFKIAEAGEIKDRATIDKDQVLAQNTLKQMENAFNNILSRIKNMLDLLQNNQSTEKAIASASAA